ncbi:MAG TPA: PTPA-CTERM sorting domain-containing protein [Leptolyngbyaceae cyanobacterium M33_DOE_097]|uniref:PTPA-CTERM sorting domain-containing protein n=1 Tax=Oscillatoriales cyanobacterium SpSt-418 TaxID=2282169 RepID=A0A7C3KFM4_9CYAN|nr:PTPA-CTERM sorting domain-containing protein [Leptolyngbyaceae cyanobacterium M33_DOE_097]
MNLQKTTMTLAIAVSAMALAPAVANAASITHKTSSFSFNEETVPNGLLGSSSLPYFNTALGTLNSVTYEILGDASASVTFTNLSKTRTGYASAYASLWSYGYLNPSFSSWYGYVEAYASAYSNSLAPGGSISDTATNNYVSGPITLTESYLLDLFKGSGNFAVEFYGYFNGSSYTNLSNYLVSSTGEVNGLRAKITYDYTPIPTPALLPGLLALGAGFLRKRKVEEAVEVEA